jgi:hydroxyacylglutathione hydrolase
MRIVPVPCLEDNYAYLVICEETGRAAVVDPSESDPVRAAVRREGIELAAIWNTHHHPDHVGGNAALARDAKLAVVAHASERARVPVVNQLVEEGDVVRVGGIAARILFNPGHTTGAISFHVERHPAVFTGDTLFGAGCGRLFEGTAEAMFASLTKLAALPPDTQVFCGHEYTASNLAFARAVEPDNQRVVERSRKVAALGGRPSVPSTIEEERATNPFLRATEPAVAAAARDHGAQGDDPVAVFAALRRWKDGFRAS